ncbi:MAG: porin family protein [Lacibacter sp.]
MKKFTVLTFLSLMFAISNAKAQVSFGIKGGLNIGNMLLKSGGDKISTNSLMGVHFGLIGDYDISDNVSFETGLLFCTTGAKSNSYSIDEKISLNYLKVPINLKYAFSSESNFKPYFFGGPYFAFGVGGKITSGGLSEKISFGTSDNDDVKPVDIGLNIGGGICFNKRFFASVEYDLGLANLAISSDDKIQNRGFSISIGYRFVRGE